MTIHTQEYATRSLLVREQIAPHRLWIEEKLGTSLSETVLIDGLPNLSQVGVHKFLQIPEQQRIWNRVAARLMSDAHGQGKRMVKPAPRHAEFAVNLAGAVAMFLVTTHQSSPPPSSGGPNSS